MEMTKIQRGHLQLLGAAFFVQAFTSLLGGAVFFKPFVSDESILATMNNFANHIPAIYCGIFLQIITAIVIVMLGVAIYQTAGYVNKTVAMIALSLYVFEAVLLAVSQVFVLVLVKVSQLFLIEGTGFVNLGNILLSLRDFTALLAIIPFGIGAIFFYSLLMKARIIPKWLARWGLVTVPIVLVGATLMAFGVTIPVIIVIPYVPFEFVAGIYILTNPCHLKKN